MLGILRRCFPPVAEPQGRSRSRGCCRRLPPRRLAGTGRPLVRAGPQGPGVRGLRGGAGRGTIRAAPAPQRPPPLPGVRRRCCPWVLSLRHRGLETQNVRQPRGKSNPLKAGETPSLIPSVASEGPSGGMHCSVPRFTACSPKGNSIAPLCQGTGRASSQTGHLPVALVAACAGLSQARCMAPTKVPKPRWEEMGTVNLRRSSRQSHQHGLRPPIKPRSIRRQSLILAIPLPKLCAASLTISTGAGQQ